MRFYSFFIISFLFPVSAIAEDVNSFFNVNAARSVFGDEITRNENTELEMLKPIKSKKQEQKDNKKTKDDKEKAPVEVVENQSITEKYGDPEREVPVVAQENAPKPFKGMLAALDAGDRDLAFKYARQYQKYMHKLDQVVQEAVVLQQLAGEAEGVAAPGNSGELSEERIEFEKHLKGETEKQLQIEHRNVNNLSPEARAFLNEAAKAEGLDERLPNGELIEEEANARSKALKQASQDEQQARAQIRAKVAGKTPHDPKGQVDVFFVFRTSDKNSIAMAKEFEKFYQNNKSDPNTNILALTFDKEDQGSVEAFRGRIGGNFPAQNGSIFTKQAGVTKVPAVVFMARNTGQALVDEGMRNYLYMDEVSSLIRGGK